MCSQTARRDGPDIKIEKPEDASLSAESIAEDIPEKSVSEDTTIHEDDTTVHDESENDARDALPREPSKKGHDSGRKLEIILLRGKNNPQQSSGFGLSLYPHQTWRKEK